MKLITLLTPDVPLLHVRMNYNNTLLCTQEFQFINSNTRNSSKETLQFTELNPVIDYLPTPNPCPLPMAWNPPNGLADAAPFPVPEANPPLAAFAIPTPVAETPPGPALALPNPAPLPDAGLMTERWQKFNFKLTR